jgi:DNA-binding transcriptional ArsR family regulator
MPPAAAAARRTQRALDDTLLALSDPTRRAILQRLALGEARVTELAKPFSISLNAVSKHIRMLERARLVRRRRLGREHFLSFDGAALDDAAAWIERQRAFWTSRLDALDALLEAEPQSRKPTRKEITP